MSSEVAAETASDRLTVLDPDGDLILRVRSGDAIQCFKVCSAIMRLASPVFKAMLFGPWKESMPSVGQWLVDLEDDSPAGMHHLLDIVHAQFKLPPDTLAPATIADILKIADKYQMYHVTRPYISYWTSQIVQHRSTHELRMLVPCYLDHIGLLRAGWALGAEDAVLCQIWDLAMSSVPQY
ncbi:hypothetical protein VTJ04DRAFT_5401 [Mycothermus thermophilus]|uniref:uncharacterized protein n=1 Tax=Humicola insolens TaxID=85995 RepID=UPI003744A8E5